MKEILRRVLFWIFKGVPKHVVEARIYQLDSTARLKDKVVVVTGGGRGLGFYIAKKLAKEGASVLITGRNETSLKKASDDLNNCPYIVLDMKETDSFDSFFLDAEIKLGKVINCIVNNAGISLHEHSFEEVTVQGYDDQFNTNIKGPFFFTQSFFKYAKRKGIDNLNVLFITSERGFYGDTIPYGLTKAAVNSLTQGLARRYVTKRVRVNAIAPGVTASDMTRVEKEGNLYRELACGQRVLVPEEIAESAAFLLSDESGCITGEILPCNQGNHLRSDYHPSLL